MKVERVLCDLCGAVIGREEMHGTLIAPDSNAQQARTPPELWTLMISPRAGKEYDVCLGCIEGLLASRGLMKHKLRECEAEILEGAARSWKP